MSDINCDKAIKILSGYTNSYFGDKLHGGEIGVENIIKLLKDYDELRKRHKLLLETADDIYCALKEKEKIIEQYHEADGFLAVHGWKWEDADGRSGSMGNDSKKQK